MAQLDGFVQALRDFFNDVPEDIKAEEDEVISRVDTAYKILGRDISAQDISDLLGNWLSEYFKYATRSSSILRLIDLKFIIRLRIIALEDTPLGDIWYTGSTPFPSEVLKDYMSMLLNGCNLIRSLQLINPSPRATILSGLIHPQGYVSPGQPSKDNEDDDLPDTSILFKGYLESGKMINVYDWFESFTVVLEGRKRRLENGKTRLPDDARGKSRTPSKKKGKQKQVEDEVVNENAGEDKEEWQMEVQARFIRTLQELDYIGFIKHTGRKADHVMRTVFDPPE